MTASSPAGAPPAAVFFDVDFTLIYPGPTFQGEGYARFCARYGISVEAARFPAAVRAASAVLDDVQEHVYDPRYFVRYTARIIEEMGGAGPRVLECAHEIYEEWAACQHFSLYDDVSGVLRDLAARGVKLGLISNAHRSLATFQEHFALDGLITTAVSSAEHGFMKPHPSIFEAALRDAQVDAAEAVMVGDSLPHDIQGAIAIGMRGVLVHRSADPVPPTEDVPVIRSLTELPPLFWQT